MKRIKPCESTFFGLGTKVYFCLNEKVVCDRIRIIRGNYAVGYAYEFPLNKLNKTWFFHKREAKEYLEILAKKDDTISDVDMSFGDVRKGNFFKVGDSLYLKVGYDTALEVENGEFSSDTRRFYQYYTVTNKIGMNLNNFWAD